jgi:hypothetical protein
MSRSCSNQIQRHGGTDSSRLTPFSVSLFLCVLLPLSLQSQSAFEEVSQSAGINNTGLNHGVALADFDQDGDEDIYVSRIDGTNLLYQNQGNGKFIEVAAQYGLDHAGKSYLSVWGDLDNDGDPDLYVGNGGQANRLFRNDGTNGFVDITQMAGVGHAGRPRSINLADVDLDGYLDIYIANLGGENVLYRNRGDLRFTDIIQESGATDQLIAMGAIFFDYDNDGDPDLYLTHDNNQANILYENDGSGHFTDVSAVSGTNIAAMGMGVDAGDINNDGWLDLYITNLSYNALLLNRGDGTFANLTLQSQTADRGMGWGCIFLDYDLDGWVDIYTANDSYFSPFPNVLYRNLGDLSFALVESESPLSSMFAGYGTAQADFNLDGWPDIFLVNSGKDGNQLFLNQKGENHWVKLQLQGNVSNRAAIGARVTLKAGGQTQIRETTAGSGYASQNSLIQYFGLGANDQIDSVHIRWPSGQEDVYTNLAVDQWHLLNEGVQVIIDSLPDFYLHQYPNPVRSQLNLEFMLYQDRQVQIDLIDFCGRSSVSLWEGEMPSGANQLDWSLASYPLGPGAYLLRVRAEGFQQILKVLYLPE